MIRNVIDYLEDSANKYPDKIAFSDSKKSVTFSKLREQAKAIGTALIDKNIKGKPVAVCMNKSVDAITAFMGVLYAGGFYAPIDVGMPEKRIQLILETLDSGLLIVDKEGNDKISNVEYSILPMQFDDLVQVSPSDEKIFKIKESIIDFDPVYIIFTSGSTGVPKGVVQSHRAVIDFIEWFSETANFDHTTVFANQAPFYFDMSVKDLYGTLRNGATDYITPHELFSFPTKMFEYLNENKVNTLTWATSAVTLCANDKAFEKEPLKYVNKICFGGEALPVKVLYTWKKYLPNAMYMNMYGPTETAVDCTYYIVDREFELTDHLPAGKACKNTQIIILNGDKEAAVNEIGEICVRGASLAYGYYNNPEKTKEVFVQNPVQKAYPELIYRTGDLGYINERGEIMFASRKDDQIKHMGYRIELGEIETALNSIEAINMCCCLFNKVKDQIVCVYTGDIERRDIILELSKLIPKYMWPNKFIKLDVLPMNLNGKIDRVKLKELYISQL